MCSQVFIFLCFLSRMSNVVLRCGHSLKSYEDCNMETQGPQPGCLSQAFPSFPTSSFCLFSRLIFLFDKKRKLWQTTSLQMGHLHAWGALEQQECCLVLLEETCLCIVFRGLNLLRATMAWICNEKNARHVFLSLLLGSGPQMRITLYSCYNESIFSLFYRDVICVSWNKVSLWKKAFC